MLTAIEIARKVNSLKHGERIEFNEMDIEDADGIFSGESTFAEKMRAYIDGPYSFWRSPDSHGKIVFAHD